MARPVTGWEQASPVPDGYKFNDYLSARGGRLYFEELDLAQLLLGGREDQGLGRVLPSPLEIAYLPKIRQKIKHLRGVFADAIRETGYAGKFHYAYTSKANVAEEVVSTALATGVHYEITSNMDIEVVRLMMAAGHLRPGQMVICNGFKAAGMKYADSIVRLKGDHPDLIPVVEDLSELPPLIESGLPFAVGLRQKSYGHYTTEAQMDAANSRFGMSTADVWRAAEIIAASPNLELKLYHAMIGSQIPTAGEFVAWLSPAIELYARLRQKHPSLSIFDFGGGLPAPLTLDFEFDYPAFVRRLLTTLQEVCGRYGVPAPDVMGEFGRYTVSEHGAHLFKVLAVKNNGSAHPWYIVDGSIMSSFPDTWAIGEHFIVLPLNHLDRPFQRVQLGGITCDSDDVYPPPAGRSPLYLPVATDPLYIGFFSIGAYQEMLGGAGGTKHCVIPEADELIVDRDASGKYLLRHLAGQSAARVLFNLGYVLP